jgi:hypothetical protein
LEAQGVALPASTHVELAREVRKHLLGGAARGGESHAVLAMDLDVCHQ